MNCKGKARRGVGVDGLGATYFVNSPSGYPANSCQNASPVEGDENYQM